MIKTDLTEKLCQSTENLKDATEQFEASKMDL